MLLGSNGSNSIFIAFVAKNLSLGSLEKSCFLQPVFKGKPKRMNSLWENDGRAWSDEPPVFRCSVIPYL